MTQVSVVTPFYNTEDYLHQCIQSVLDERQIDVELVLVDDGSTDNSARIAEHYCAKDSRVKLLSQPNQGQGVARNLGIDHAVGRYIYFLDSDDYVEADCLRILYESSESSHLEICAPASPKYYYDRPLEYLACIPTRMQFVQRDLIEEFNVRQPAVPSGQDGVFGHLLLTHCKRFGVAEKALCRYRHERPGSTFARYVKRTDLVPGIIAKHYQWICEHYDRYDLWDTQAVRFLTFVSDETMRNRINLHFNRLSVTQRLEIFSALKPLVERAVSHLPRRFGGTLHPAVVAVAQREPEDAIEYFRQHYVIHKLDQPIPAHSNAFQSDTRLHVCKPYWRPTARNSDYVKAFDRSFDNTNDRVRLIESKVDFLLNSLVNMQAENKDVYARPGAKAQKTSEPRLVVSLTTLPSRLATVHLTIESIFAQTLLPDRIVLWIDEKASFDIQRYPRLQQAIEKGLEIRSVPDVGPHTKLVYALQNFPQATIITVDDDMIYPSITLGTLERFSQEFPGMVVANWARALNVSGGGTIQGVRGGRLLTPTRLEKEIEQEIEFAPRPSFLAFGYGTSGMLYPAGSLDPMVMDFDLMRELCPKEDDIWFKAMSLLADTPVVPTNLGINPKHYSVFGSQNVALRHVNHGGGSNFVQMKNVFDYFSLYSKLSDEREREIARRLDHPW